jgi:hypothetical protein
MQCDDRLEQCDTDISQELHDDNQIKVLHIWVVS